MLLTSQQFSQNHSPSICFQLWLPVLCTPHSLHFQWQFSVHCIATPLSSSVSEDEVEPEALLISERALRPMVADESLATQGDKKKNCLGPMETQCFANSFVQVCCGFGPFAAGPFGTCWVNGQNCRWSFARRQTFQLLCIKHAVSIIKRQASSIKHSESNNKNQASSIEDRASSIEQHASSSQHQASSINNQASNHSCPPKGVGVSEHGGVPTQLKPNARSNVP